MFKITYWSNDVADTSSESTANAPAPSDQRSVIVISVPVTAIDAEVRAMEGVSFLLDRIIPGDIGAQTRVLSHLHQRAAGAGAYPGVPVQIPQLIR